MCNEPPIQKYNSLEGAIVKSDEVKELTNLKTLRDPWGNAYGHAHSSGEVYSKGPDGKHSADPGSPDNKDDITVSYLAAPKTIKTNVSGDGPVLKK